MLSAYHSDYVRGRGALAENLVLLTSATSTNAVARSIADAYEERETELPHTVIAALSQTEGRGRMGRVWESRPLQGVYCSLLMPRLSTGSLERLPVATAVGACAALRSLVGGQCVIKWPNDLIVNGCKIAGILIETVMRQGQVIAVIGIGINYSRGTGALPDNAISLTQVSDFSAEKGSLAYVAGTTVHSVLEEIYAMQCEPDPTLEKYRRWSAHSVGESMVCSTAGSTRLGRFVGFDRQGFLRLETSDGETTISSGEIIETWDG